MRGLLGFNPIKSQRAFVYGDMACKEVIKIRPCGPNRSGSVGWYQSAKQRVASLIPGQGTCLGFGPGPQWEAHERQPHIDVSLPAFL